MHGYASLPIVRHAVYVRSMDTYIEKMLSLRNTILDRLPSVGRSVMVAHCTSHYTIEALPEPLRLQPFTSGAEHG